MNIVLVAEINIRNWTQINTCNFFIIVENNKLNSIEMREQIMAKPIKDAI